MCQLAYAGPVEPEPCWPPTDCIPVNNGVIILIAAGLFFGFRMLWVKKQKNKPGVDGLNCYPEMKSDLLQ
jgi:hypothetical protein